MDIRRSLACAALAAAFLPVALLTPSTARAASLASPAAWPAYCAGPLPAVVPPLDRGTLLNPDDHSDLVLATPGLPGNSDGGTPVPTAITAGSGWHYFELTASLPMQSANSDLRDSPHDLKWTVFVSYGPGKSGLDASDVQYQNGGSRSVEYAGAGAVAGIAVGAAIVLFTRRRKRS